MCVHYIALNYYYFDLPYVVYKLFICVYTLLLSLVCILTFFDFFHSANTFLTFLVVY
jgi:hypothetical protein